MKTAGCYVMMIIIHRSVDVWRKNKGERDMAKKILSMLLVCIMIFGMTAAGASQTAQNDLWTILRVMSGGRDAEIFLCADYDGDGREEAFALIGQERADGSYEGEIWFVSKQECVRLRRTGTYLNLKSVWSGQTVRFVVWEVLAEGVYDTLMWKVEAGKAKAVSETGEDADMPTEEGPASIGSYTGHFITYANSVRPNNNPPVDSSRIADGNLTTAWNSHELLYGARVRMTTADGEAYRIAGLRIAAGYWKSEEVYYNNARPGKVEVYCDGEYVTAVKLKDAVDYQTFWFDEPVTASRVELRVINGYRGTKYDDCCITEIELLGPMGDMLLPGALDDWGAGVREARKYIQSGKTIKTGSYGIRVAGLQLLLREGFGILDDEVDGVFGEETLAAVEELAQCMRAALRNCRPMRSGVVDQNYWDNMMDYMELIG